ncbi:MAG: hypothetical protein ACYTGR_09520 [Planctomycetota bacterium]|jgi:hypothetical protein
MRSRRFLNVILSLNAILLAGLLWASLAGRPIFASQAVAQVRSKPAMMAPNAADQRATMIREMRNMQHAVDGMSKLLESGRVKVSVTNLAEARSLNN